MTFHRLEFPVTPYERQPDSVAADHTVLATSPKPEVDLPAEAPAGDEVVRQPRTRRTVLTGVGLSALGLATGCSSYGSGAAPVEQATAPSAPEGSGSAGSASPGSSSAALASTTDIPVGGGTVFADAKVVVTQPTAGEFKAFSAICTHAGCPVSEVAETINCPCHGSKFSVADGSVTAGPASSPLAAKRVTVTGDKLSIS